MLSPRYYQADAFNDFIDYSSDHPDENPLIVLPTGSGKSFINAMIIQDVIAYPKTRVLCLTHQKDLIQQNLDEYLGIVGQDQAFTVGVYSAGLRSRDTEQRIIFAGIQSVHSRAYELGRFSVIIIDEVHRVPMKSEGTYRKFLNDMRKINKRCLIVGLSATPYRLKGGLLCDESHKERIFHEICHETTMTELMDAHHKKNRDKKQYLCPLISKNSINRADMSGVSKTGGDYNAHEMEEAFNKSDLILCAVKEIKELAFDRKKILVFTTGINHCEAVTAALMEYGITAGCIHSQKLDIENEQIKNDFKIGKINCLVNIDILTTGFNLKAIDCIAMLRSTMSPGLYVQIAGRGTRMHEDKENCLFLDFGGNILRHGCVDQIEIVRGGGKKKNGKVGTCPMKECPQCHNAIHLSVKICPECGYTYPEEEPKHDKEASNESILSGWKAPITVDVKSVSYSAHEKPGKTKSLRVDYYYNDMRGYYSEWVCLEHEGFAKNKAFQWIKARLKDGITVSAIPTVDQVLARPDVLNEPKQIMVDFNEKFPKITGFIF